ncbi:hypothetical protein FEM48_Zijuj09G0197900 [Ziziphus jujuba var. spinosa]|uniref:Protein PELPK1-like n=1 Tax=Ziziphus jujuba var. spinosa TaxID=714518 RepID=A0A978UUZ2_ZIZJJ|nr:hypothetical protein FEM48_Zijuj09G0197900 [Ziziphus jujuba var. spinosa]
MAMDHKLSTTSLIPLLLTTFMLMISFFNSISPTEARHLLQTTPKLPDLPTLPEPELPTLPDVELQPLPEIPKPELPNLPELPELPELPHLPELTHVPKLPTLSSSAHSTANP